jgi:hypothetical protein
MNDRLMSLALDRDQVLDSGAQLVGVDLADLLDDRAVGGDEQGDGEGDGADAVGELGEPVAQQLVLDAALAGEALHDLDRVDRVDAVERDVVGLGVDLCEVGQLASTRRTGGEPQVDHQRCVAEELGGGDLVVVAVEQHHVGQHVALDVVVAQAVVREGDDGAGVGEPGIEVVAGVALGPGEDADDGDGHHERRSEQSGTDPHDREATEPPPRGPVDPAVLRICSPQSHPFAARIRWRGSPRTRRKRNGGTGMAGIRRRRRGRARRSPPPGGGASAGGRTGACWR